MALTDCKNDDDVPQMSGEESSVAKVLVHFYNNCSEGNTKEKSSNWSIFKIQCIFM